MRKTALTAYGLIGTDWIRVTAAILETGIAFVRADGTNTPLGELPTAYRTSGDIVNVASTLNHRVNMAAVPKVGLPNHTWKTVFDLAGIAAHFGVAQSIVDGLLATYADVDAIAA